MRHSTGNGKRPGAPAVFRLPGAQQRLSHVRRALSRTRHFAQILRAHTFKHMHTMHMQGTELTITPLLKSNSLQKFAGA